MLQRNTITTSARMPYDLLTSASKLFGTDKISDACSYNSHS